MKKVYISPSNSKMGGIPSVSLPPIDTCARNLPCINGCYAYMICKRYPSVKKSYNNNFYIYLENPDRYFSDIEAYLSGDETTFFRFHVSGDFPDMKYLRKCFEITKAFPGTKFLAFTKRYEFMKKIIKRSEIPENFTIIISSWPKLSIPKILKQNFRIAWLQDGTEKRVPSDALACPGTCETCGMCWSLPQIGKDVFFKKK